MSTLVEQLITYTSHELTTCGIFELEGYISVVLEVNLTDEGKCVILAEEIFPQAGKLVVLDADRDSVTVLPTYPILPTLRAI